MPKTLRPRQDRPGTVRHGPPGGEPVLSRPARVLRIAPLPIRSDRLRELRRILGDDVQITETTLTEPDAVEAIAASIPAEAVVIDVVAPPALPALVAALASYTLLRPLFEHVPTSRGERQPVFAGYAALTADGVLEALADGALTIPE
ncbi:MAG: hypothetical protein LC808_27550 [Actinobacteria bacterium]|nr:hypothetical protein [Actinomycetota bacterium]